MKNIIKIIDSVVAIICITNKKGQYFEVKIDTIAIPTVQQYKWFITQEKERVRCCARNPVTKKIVYLHNVILNEYNAIIFHNNGDKLDCRKENLTKKQNQYEIEENYVVLYTTNKEKFYIDIEDLDRVKKHVWSLSSHNYLVAHINNNKEYLHRFILQEYYNIDDYVIDHQNHYKWDNRKKNLRIVTQSENGMNKTQQSNNTSGETGVFWHNKSQKWSASITAFGKTVYLGLFEDKNIAIKIRKEYEEKLFKEFSYTNSVKKGK